MDNFLRPVFQFANFSFKLLSIFCLIYPSGYFLNFNYYIFHFLFHFLFLIVHFLFILLFIGVQLIYNVVLTSSAPHSDSIVVWSLNHVLCFCDSMDCSPPGSSFHGISQVRILEGLPVLLQGILPTLGSNPSLLHWQADSFYHRATREAHPNS